MTTALPLPVIAYVDASAALSVAFREEDWEITARCFAAASVLTSANLLEAELRAAYWREGLAFDASAMAGIGWVIPNRSLGREVAKALEVGGYLKGGDLWHIATALYIDATVTGKLAFITLDGKLRSAAHNLGFEVMPVR